MSLAAKLRQFRAQSDAPDYLARRFYIFQLLLDRLFADPDSGWVLKGGVGLRYRIPEARFSEDLDLSREFEPTDLGAIIKELSSLGQPTEHNPLWFTFTLGREIDWKNQGVRIHVEALLGTVRLDGFHIDLTAPNLFCLPTTPISPQMVFDFDDQTREHSLVQVYSIPDQVADKLSGIYDAPHGRTSTRYRDLVDLVLIFQHLAVDTAQTANAIAHRFIARQISIPNALRAPHTNWETKYAELAKATYLDTKYQTLTAALTFLTQEMDPILTRSRAIVTATQAQLAAYPASPKPTGLSHVTERVSFGDANPVENGTERE